MYYKLPFDFADIMAGHDAPECNLYESIAQHLQILVTTRYGENRYDANYGNGIWELEFEKGMGNAQWEEAFRKSVTETVDLYEPRLNNNKVTIHTELVEKNWPLKNYTEVKKKATVLIRSTLVGTGEIYSFKTEIYLSPLSID